MHHTANDGDSLPKPVLTMRWFQDTLSVLELLLRQLTIPSRPLTMNGTKITRTAQRCHDKLPFHRDLTTIDLSLI